VKATWSPLAVDRVITISCYIAAREPGGGVDGEAVCAWPLADRAIVRPSPTVGGERATPWAFARRTAASSSRCSAIRSSRASGYPGPAPPWPPRGAVRRHRRVHGHTLRSLSFLLARLDRLPGQAAAPTPPVRRGRRPAAQGFGPVDCVVV